MRRGEARLQRRRREEERRGEERSVTASASGQRERERWKAPVLWPMAGWLMGPRPALARRCRNCGRRGGWEEREQGRPERCVTTTAAVAMKPASAGHHTAPAPVWTLDRRWWGLLCQGRPRLCVYNARLLVLRSPYSYAGLSVFCLRSPWPRPLVRRGSGREPSSLPTPHGELAR